MRGICQTCGASYDTDHARAHAPAYFFSSVSRVQGSYTTAAAILLLGEDILTCPLDASLDTEKLGYAADSFTPGGASMATGADRYTEGDSTDPDPPAPRSDAIIQEP
jgi:hypothetical protein